MSADDYLEATKPTTAQILEELETLSKRAEMFHTLLAEYNARIRELRKMLPYGLRTVAPRPKIA